MEEEHKNRIVAEEDFSSNDNGDAQERIFAFHCS